MPYRTAPDMTWKHEKKILRQSDLWPCTLVFGAITLAALAYMTLHLAAGEMPEAFTMGFVAVFPLVLTLFCAFTDRGEAMRRRNLLIGDSPSESSQRWANRLSEELKTEAWQESGLNPANSDRARRALDGKPDIG